MKVTESLQIDGSTMYTFKSGSSENHFSITPEGDKKSLLIDIGSEFLRIDFTTANGSTFLEFSNAAGRIFYGTVNELTTSLDAVGALGSLATFFRSLPVISR